MYAFAEYCFKGTQVKSIDLVKVTGSCQIKRIFSMLNPLYDDELNSNEELLQKFEQLRSTELRFET